ncbi:MAG: hypothetical protein K6C10_02455 [Prevotella sp.]|nr:hypothetical protein [Prevotella sp.]
MKRLLTLWMLFVWIFLNMPTAKAADMGGYLFAYFRGNDTSQEHLFYAISADGLNYTPLNGGNAVVDFSDIAVKGNIRDPFITRAEDGTWLMVCTDMRSSDGWSSNRGIVMSKSEDLANWTHSTVNFPTKYSGTTFANVTRVWAPEVIYDREAERYMVYFSILTSDGNYSYDKVMYCYANDDFTDLDGEPTHLFDRGSATIDMTIVYNEQDAKYHAFYKNENEQGIGHVSATKLTAGSGKSTGSQWSTASTGVQQTDLAVEGPSVFKRISDGKWILAYDCYAASPAFFEMCEVSDDFSTYELWGDCANHDAFTPRHGSIVQLSDEEIYNLDIALGGNSELIVLRKELLAEITKAEAMGVDAADEKAVSTTKEASRLQLQAAINSMKEKEYVKVSSDYPNDASILLSSPTTNNIATNSGQHWDGTSSSIYYEQPGSSWSASSWTSSMEYTASLPQGEYVFKVACRAAGSVTGTISCGSSTETIPTNGDVGYGINLDGETSFSVDDNFANSNKGRGWEWRYIPVTVTAEEETVTFVISASASTNHQWFSVTNIGLLSKEAVAVEVVSDEQNETTIVSQVKNSVNITTPIDYVVSSSTPFTTTGSVNIANDGAVLIFSGLKPSEVISSWLTFVTINGEAAENGNNCQVKIYGDGAIVMPYGSAFLPLVVYQDYDYTGQANNQYAVSTKYNLSGTTFDNSIRSFTLRRGYSVCLSAKADGLGYSRVWVADKKNLKVDLKGTPLDGTASFIRVLQWNDTSKKGWAGGQSTQNALLNTTWYYNWNDNGELNSPDREYVPIRQQPWWPGLDVGSGANVMGYNEFDNSVEDSYKELVKIAGSSDEDAILNAAVDYWTYLLKTGKRIGSPSVANWGNNFSGGMLAKFIDKLDEKGYRCDFIVTHCYWYNDWSSWSSWLTDIYNLFPGRQIWITEMNYGANWTGWPGSSTSASADNYAIELQHFGPIVDGLESTDFIERYAVYNDVQECRYMYNASDASLASSNYLTPMGQYYANKASNIGYKADLNTYVPNTSRWMKDPVLTKALQDSDESTTTIGWTDANGEYIKEMYIEKLEGSTWTTVYSQTDLLTDGGSYEHEFTESEGGTYRIHTVDLCGVDRYSDEVVAGSADNAVGSKVEYDGETYYLGGNVIPNGDFNYGFTGWTDGTGNSSPAKANLEIVPVAGPDNGAYLRTYGHTGVDGVASLKGVFGVVSNQPYLFSVWHKNHDGGWQKASLSSDGTTESEEVANLSTVTDWSRVATTFSTGSYSQFLIKYRWLNSTAKFDKFTLQRLFPTEQEAYDDGVEQLLVEAEAFKNWNTSYADINTELSSRLTTATNMDHSSTEAAKNRYLAAATALEEGFVGVSTKKTLDSLLVVANRVADEAHPRYSLLLTAINNAVAAETVAGYSETLSALRTALEQYLELEDVTSLIQNPTFTSSTGWETKTGSFTGGDQRLNNIWGRTCWNAWWSTSDEGTLEVRQTLSDLPEGYYYMECVATTQPFCITDQHGYISNGTATENTPTLTYERFDSPGITNADVWESLATLPVWVDEGGSLTIGFLSSKEGKQTANPVYTDNREGWWCATDFHLYRYNIPDFIIGDVNYDGEISIADVTALVNIILGKDSTEPYQYNHEAADVNQDEAISIADVTALVNIILGK